MAKRLGITFCVDLYGCKGPLNSDTKMEQILCAAASKAHATVLNAFSYKFSPQGVTSIVAISESHIAVHSWPEHKFASIDVYTCGNEAMPERAVDHIIAKLVPDHFDQRIMTRGTKVRIPWDTLETR